MTTKNLIPRASGEGGIGVTNVTWGYGYYDTGNFNKGLFVKGSGIEDVIANTVTQGGLGGEWERNGLDIYYNGGNVGIGVTDPGNNKLYVNGRIKTDSITGSNGLSIASGGTGNLNLYHGIFGDTAVLGISIAATGNVGIGTTDPSTALDIHGTLAFKSSGIYINATNAGGDVNSNDLTLTAAAASNSIVARAARHIIFQTYDPLLVPAPDYVERLRINHNGNVGIGTTNPDAKLDIQNPGGSAGSTSQHIKLTRGTTVGAYFSTIRAPATNDVSDLVLGVNTTNALTIKDNGNVGIGVAAPAAKLDILKGGGAQYDTVDGLDVFRNVSEHVFKLSTGGWRNASVINQQTGSGTAGLTRASYGLYLNSTYGSKLFASASVHVNCSAGNGDISFLTGNGDAAPGTKIKIQNNGNVGIGTTNPGVKLDVNGSIRGDSLTAVTNAGFSAVFSKTNEQPAIKFIGTPSNVGLNYAFAIDAVDGNNNKFELVRMNDADQTVQELLTIQSNGNVGIGTTDPGTNKLYVNGNIFANGTITPTSDDRVKHNEQTIVGAIEILGKLTPKKYIKTTEMYDADHDFELDANGDPVDENGEPVAHAIEAGVIAQKVLEVPELAFTVSPEGVDEDGNVTSPHGLNYNSLFTYGIAAIQEQQQLIEDLKSRIETLENK